MGMFDQVNARCPNCGETVEFQSKAGDCTLAAFEPHSVPIEIAKDIDGDSEYCSCGHLVKIRCLLPIDVVPMQVL